MDDIVHALAEFAATLTATEDFDDTAEQLISYAVKSVGADCGGITLLRARGRLETFGATSPVVTRADHAQYELGEGPCIDAATTERSVVSGSVEVDPRWPRWGPAVAELGVHSVLSAEIHGRGSRIGALNLYGSTPRAFSRQDVEIATILADQSAAVLASMSVEESLRDALHSRTVIGQAQGILMERFDIDADRSFSVLRRYSQESNVKLREVAERLVRSRSSP